MSEHDPDARRVPVHDRYQAPPEVSRLAWSPVHDYLGDAHDFVLLGDTLILLDQRAAEVALLAREATGEGERWRRVRAFGRRGSGPGELRRPAGIALHPDGNLLLWDEIGRLHRFALDGSHHETSTPRLGCILFSSAIAATEDGVYIGGNCAGALRAKDTTYARVFRLDVARTEESEHSELQAREVASAPIATGDLTWGSIITAHRLLSEGPDGAYFASGLDACVVRLPDATRRCIAPPARYRTPPPAALANVRLPNGAQPRWPDPISPLFAHLAGEPPFLLQLISEDSVVLTRWAPGERPRLVAPASRFVGCRVEHCLWFDATNSRLALVSADELRETPALTTTVAR